MYDAPFMEITHEALNPRRGLHYYGYHIASNFRGVKYSFNSKNDGFRE